MSLPDANPTGLPPDLVTGRLEAVIELSFRQVVLIVGEFDQEVQNLTSLIFGGTNTPVLGVDLPRKLVELPEGGRGLDFSTLGVLIAPPPTKDDLVSSIGSRVPFEQGSN